MRLALALHYRSVREMETTLTIQEYAEWQDFHILEPWGCQVEDHRFDTLSSLIVRTSGNDVPPGGFFNRDPDKHLQLKKVMKDQMEANIMNAFGAHNARAKAKEQGPATES
jgi:hypothetical protein